MPTDGEARGKRDAHLDIVWFSFIRNSSLDLICAISFSISFAREASREGAPAAAPLALEVCSMSACFSSRSLSRSFSNPASRWRRLATSPALMFSSLPGPAYQSPSGRSPRIGPQLLPDLEPVLLGGSAVDPCRWHLPHRAGRVANKEGRTTRGKCSLLHAHANKIADSRTAAARMG